MKEAYRGISARAAAQSPERWSTSAEWGDYWGANRLYICHDIVDQWEYIYEDIQRGVCKLANSGYRDMNELRVYSAHCGI